MRHPMTPNYHEYPSFEESADFEPWREEQAMQVLTWDEFKANVEGWAEAREIYQNGSAWSQAFKAAEEAGELMGAVAKGDIDEQKDAVGDILVCLVNYCKMAKLSMASPVMEEDYSGTTPAHYAAEVNFEVSRLALTSFSDDVTGYHNCVWAALAFLSAFCTASGFDVMECCTKAWNEIKDRKGRMVEGGAFIKEED